MERDAITFTMQYVDAKFPITDEDKAHLIIEVDGNDMDVLMKDCEKISEIMYEHQCLNVLFAESAQQKADLWKLRRSTGEAIKSHSIYKEEDTVVPRAALPQLLSGVKSIGKKYGFESVCYGHAGDGNLHVNIIKQNLTDAEWNEKVPLGIQEIFSLCVSLGGTISGEHGIGYVQKKYLPIAFNQTQINIQKGIKKLFDPKHILNPGKIFS
jgi:glycolate oxidase